MGSLHVELKRSGKRRCRCRDGRLHGPYAYLRWWEGGRLRRRYVRPADVPGALAAIAVRRSKPMRWPARRLLRTLRQLEREWGG